MVVIVTLPERDTNGPCGRNLRFAITAKEGLRRGDARKPNAGRLYSVHITQLTEISHPISNRAPTGKSDRTVLLELKRKIMDTEDCCYGFLCRRIWLVFCCKLQYSYCRYDLSCSSDSHRPTDMIGCYYYCCCYFLAICEEPLWLKKVHRFTQLCSSAPYSGRSSSIKPSYSRK